MFKQKCMLKKSVFKEILVKKKKQLFFPQNIPKIY